MPGKLDGWSKAVKIVECPYVIVQAGGRGTRLRHHAANKPKCLLSVDGEPLLYRLFNTFPKAAFIVIGDYKHDILEAYIRVVRPPVAVELIKAEGHGTLAGLQISIDAILDDHAPFNLVWSDLLFGRSPEETLGARPLIGLSKTFECRWSMTTEGALVQLPSTERGIAGFFTFPNKASLGQLPAEGEFVDHLSRLGITFDAFHLSEVHELGTIEALHEYERPRPTSRYFNHVEFHDHQVVKRARDGAFSELLHLEADWYETVNARAFSHIPALISRNPFSIARIAGRHPFHIDCDESTKRTIIRRAMATLDELHALDARPSNLASLHDVYIQKPLDRIASVAQLIHHVNDAAFRVNRRWCRNPVHVTNREWFRQKAGSVSADTFTIIHGDPTFSNMIVGEDQSIWLIDPRGYFGQDRIYGDPNYDWAKLYYSAFGNYDAFNRKRFKLRLSPTEIEVTVESSGWEATTDLLRDRLAPNFDTIELLHALIWLSLSGYVKDDYDSILAAFYLGAYWLEQTE